MRLPRKLKKKYKKRGLLTFHLCNFKFRMSLKGILEYVKRPTLTSLLTKGLSQNCKEINK